MVVPEFPLTSEAFIYRQAQALNTWVCTYKHHQNEAVESELEIIELAGENEKSLLGGLWSLVRYGNTHQMAPQRQAAFIKLLEQRRPSYVLAQYGPTGLEVMQACRQMKIPLVVHFHGYDLSMRLKKRGYRYSLRNLGRHAHGAVAVNQIQRQRLLKLGFDPKQIWVIPCGVPLDKFSVGCREPNADIKFLAVGRLVEKKAPIKTLLAFFRCLRSYPQAHLTWIGAGPMEEELRKLIAFHNQNDRVKLLGAVTNEQVREEMASADVFVQHSITSADGDEEGWPVAIAEAAASGLPVVATRHTGIVDQVIENESGFLVDEKDVEGMSAHMVDLARDAFLRQQMGLKARAHMEENGDFQKSIAKLQEVLES
jgi:glycosyltransferase involved in cell wall biosynthesis